MSALRAWVLLSIALGSASGAAAAADPQVRAVRRGHEVAISQKETVAANVVAMLESCTVNSTGTAVAEKTWAQQLAGDSFLHVLFSRPRELYLKSADNEMREARAIDEILLPLPEGKWPPHVYARSGGETLSFSKYSGVPLKDIVMDGELRLGAVPPYDFLIEAAAAVIMRSLALFLAAAILHFALSVAGILMTLPAAFEMQGVGFWAAPGKAALVWTAAVLLAPLGWVRPLLPESAELGFGMVAAVSALFGAAVAGLFHLWRALRSRKAVAR